MKTRAFFLTIWILCGLSAAIWYGKAAQSHLDRPTLEQLMQAKDDPMVIKQLILHLKEEMEVDNDRFPELIQEVEDYTAQRTDSATKAILHSMIAEMYHVYFQENQWTISRRTPLSGYVPEDIREWSANLFEGKIREELTRSLQPAHLLQQTSTQTYKVLMETGKDARDLRPTLFEFLAFRALEIQPSEAIYQAILAFQGKNPGSQELLLTQLDHLRFLYGDKMDEASYQAYRSALDSLYINVKDKAYGAEIWIARLDLETSGWARLHAANEDSIKAKEIQICEEGIRRHARYPRTVILRNRLAQLEHPSFTVATDNTVYPGEDLRIQLYYKNVSQLKVEIFRGKERIGKPTSFALKVPNTYITQDTILRLPVGEPGSYTCKVSVPGQKEEISTSFCVSRIAAVFRNYPGDKREIWVTDFRSGKPIENALVTYYGGKRRQPQKMGAVKTDRFGLAELPSDNTIYAFKATLPGDTAGILTNLYPMGSTNRGTVSDPVEVSLFTDRGIYRPGQTLFWKGIAYVKDTDKPYAVEGKTFTVELYDANGEELARKTFTSDAFGSFNGEFTLPKQTLSGVFRLRCGQTSLFIHVEEYKRPTFHASFTPIQEEIAFGDSVSIQGKAETFSGVALPEGKVTWYVLSRPFPFWRIYASTRQVAEGTTDLSGDGTFQVTFRPEKEETDVWSPSCQSYEVYATVTDSKGETQEAHYTFSVGTSSLVLYTDLPPQIDKDSVRLTIQAQTLNGEAIAAPGTFRIVELIDRQSQADPSAAYQTGRQVASGTFVGGEAIDPKIFRDLPSGRYRLCMETKDSKGRSSENQSDFILYGKEDSRPPVFSHTWVLKEKTQCLPGEEAKILFGTSDQEAYILYEWFVGGKRIHQEQIRLSDANQWFKIPFKAEYEDGIMASFSFVKKGALFTEQIPIQCQIPDRDLRIRPITFRDHLLPGAQETWRFQVTDADSMSVPAEVLASMYDASLDEIVPFGWIFAPKRYIYLQAPLFMAGAGFQRSSEYWHQKVIYQEEPQIGYGNIDWCGLFQAGRFMAYGNRLNLRGGILMKSATAPALAMDSEDMVLAESAVVTNVANASDIATEEAGTSQERKLPTPIRENLAETAFFYPALQTDSTGAIFVQFTLPESNTAWKLQLVANTKDLKYGTLTKEILSSKPLMVVPNLPRFVRQGDEISVSTQVINQSGEEIAGRVRIELFDPATDQPVICLSKSQRAFELLPDSVATVSWQIPIPKQNGLMGVRIIADSEAGSDGEQRLLPILPDQIHLTESKTFYLGQPGEREISLPDNWSNRPEIQLTLEMTGNPIWYAVQALPTLTSPADDNILSWFAAYYSQTLATYIARSNPRIQQVIAQWSAGGEDASTLYSNLEQYQELKNILLEETPWVLEAKNETEQKQRLSLLFDLNRSGEGQKNALRQLLQRQDEQGGWSWFNGLPPSRTITLAILRGMAQLVELNAIQYGQEEKEAQIKALRFLDKQIQKDYERLREQDTKWQNAMPSPEQISYLYVRSAYRDIPEASEAREAIRFYTRQAGKRWKEYPLATKGEIARLMYRNGNKEAAMTILTWLKKTATISEELGMFWANNRQENNYFSSPIDTHCLLMETFAEIAPDKRTTDQLKQWLLAQKRTQDWASVPATVNAIHALLLTGSDWLTDGNRCVAEWNGKPYDTSDGELATGYLKTALTPAPEGEAETSALSIRKEGDTPAWGTVYASYFQEIDQVSAQKGALSVEKRLLIETANGQGRQISPVTPEQPLCVGDKVIVRLTVRTDREMSYVCLKDVRAGCLEPANPLSGTESQEGIWYYRAPKDASEQFFFERLPKGTFVLEYPVYVSRAGDYSGGISTIQCLYAPEFVSHTAGTRLIVER